MLQEPVLSTISRPTIAIPTRYKWPPTITLATIELPTTDLPTLAITTLVLPKVQPLRFHALQFPPLDL